MGPSWYTAKMYKKISVWSLMWKLKIDEILAFSLYTRMYTESLVYFLKLYIEIYVAC